MSVNIIAAEDAKALASKLRTSLLSSVGKIQTFCPTSFLKSETTQSGNSVCVIFLTTLSWQEIQRLQKEDVKRLFGKPAKTVVLWSCAASVKSAATQLFAKTVDDMKVIGLYEASGEEWYNAEARIKYRQSELENGEVHIPRASKYIIKPDTVSSLSESHAEVLIILFEADHITGVEKLKVKVDEKLFEAKKILSNVWSFGVSDFSPGDREIHVLADDVDLGAVTLHVQDCYARMKNELGKLKHEDPERFVAEFLQINITDFDRELEDLIAGSSCVAVIETLLKYGDGNEHEYPTFLHFCSKNGHESCVNWCKKYHPNFKQMLMVENKNDKTPEQLAKEMNQNQLLIQTLQTHDQEPEELEPITSPFRKGERFYFHNVREISSCPELNPMEKSRDSGCSSFHGSGERVAPTNVNATDPRPVDEKKRYVFDKRRSDHPYNTIDDKETDRGAAFYNRPWEYKTLFPNRTAHALSAGAISRTIGENEERQRAMSAGLSRSNTTGSRTTKM